MRCDEVARILPEAVDSGAAVELSVQRHIETCLRCQAELARYRKMLRGLQLLRTRYLEPAPGLLAQTLAALEEAGERQAIRSHPLGPAPRLRRRHRRRRGGRRHRGDGDDRAPLAADARAPATDLSQRPLRGRRLGAGLGTAAILAVPARPRPEGSSSIGRAPVSKTGGWGFESLLPCSERRLDHATTRTDLRTAPPCR